MRFQLWAPGQAWKFSPEGLDWIWGPLSPLLMDTRDSFSGMKLATRFCLLQMPGISGTVLYCTSAPAVCRTASTAATVPLPFGRGAVVVAVLQRMRDLEKS